MDSGKGVGDTDLTPTIGNGTDIVEVRSYMNGNGVNQGLCAETEGEKRDTWIKDETLPDC